MNLYRDEATNPKWNAQRNLQGRTHYVDDDTLRFHKSRVISVHVVGGVDRRGGLLFALIESCALDMNNTRRGFRYAIFDVFGTCLDRPTLEESYKTSDQARKAMWAYLNTVDPIAHTLAAIEHQRKQHSAEMDTLRAEVQALGQKLAA